MAARLGLIAYHPYLLALLLLYICCCLLQLSDIPKNITKVPTSVADLSGGAKLLSHELFTNDVLYAEAALDMTGLPASLLPLVPLFCRSLTQVSSRMQLRHGAACKQVLNLP